MNMFSWLIVLTSICFVSRMLPFTCARWLERWSWADKIAITLPLSITVLLVAHLLGQTSFAHYPFGVPEMAGIAAVIFTHLRFRVLLLSMGVGVFIHQIVFRYMI